ncbi:MAG: carbamoyl phosphate synthase small subunit, partial [Clostridia bacterium]|nr:carbamoyl phosphate synthase small subunit [Clostridia bacterium]
MAKIFDRKLVLEDGTQYLGFGFGGKKSSVCEVVFDTSMVGYQEVVSDPSYTSQMVVMTYPLIGNYGIVEDDFESKNPTIGGLIVRDYNDMPSNFRYTKTLSEVLEENNIPGIYGVDTRKLARF